MGGVQRQFHIRRARTGHFADDRTGNRRDILEILAADRRHEPATDEIVVTGLEGRVVGARNLGHLVHLGLLLLKRSGPGPITVPEMQEKDEAVSPPAAVRRSDLSQS